MLQKIAFFVFALGLGTSYASANLGYDLCVDSCEATWEMCRQVPQRPGSQACVRELDRCRTQCAVKYP
ncbi:hypothetical protein [Pseudoduganella violacea]|uniref:DUF3551 domain-containing protein n=1 Tax=Pseudoduganella violacea TaxID=1715466 RepID=A0A7W5B9Q2_9BURK|nr:hypothetical protein [Pseudoduganella violacea]MBB3119162.1 hypothetical protein [Pseudoduganella violacea]